MTQNRRSRSSARSFHSSRAGWKHPLFSFLSPLLSRKQKKPRQPKKSNHIKKKSVFSIHTAFWLVRWTVILGIWGGAIASCFLLWLFFDLPDLKKLELATRHHSVTLLDITGAEMASYGDLYGDRVVPQKLPPYVIQAILATEDRRFYHHKGIDILGILRAFWVNGWAGKVVQGGSTLTQQLAKNFLLSEKLYHPTDRSLRRKIQELMLALQLEQHFTKNQILSIYLNRAYFGAGVYGLEAASQKYFNKSARTLTVYEAAVLAGLLKAPSRYSPLSHPELAHARAQVILDTMTRVGLLSQNQRQEVSRQALTLQKALEMKQDGYHQARYFTDWIFEHLNTLVGHRHEDLVVKTTLHLSLQKAAEKTVYTFMKQEGKGLGAHQVALIALRPDGAVRSMVGGVDYRQSQFNRAVQAYRQAGSAFKFFIMLAALEKGYPLTTQISDRPIRLGLWAPRNYGWTSQGSLSMQEGFAHSVNAVAVRLAKKVGIPPIHTTAQKLGLLSPQPKDLTLALGTGETTLLELCQAYGVIANYGFEVKAYGVLEIRTRQGKILYRRSPLPPKRLLSSESVSRMLQLLQAVMTQGTGRLFRLNRPCAGKTGTTQNYKDAWFIGFTPDLLTGVWMGNDQGQPMKKVTGARGPGIIWKTYMTQIHTGKPIHEFPGER